MRPPRTSLDNPLKFLNNPQTTHATCSKTYLKHLKKHLEKPKKLIFTTKKTKTTNSCFFVRSFSFRFVFPFWGGHRRYYRG